MWSHWFIRLKCAPKTRSQGLKILWDNSFQSGGYYAKVQKWSSAMKFEIALQALKNDTPLTDICKKYEVAPQGDRA